MSYAENAGLRSQVKYLYRRLLHLRTKRLDQFSLVDRAMVSRMLDKARAELRVA